MRGAVAWLLATSLLAGAGCGWHLVGTGTSLDPRIKTIAVPAFQNQTKRDELVQILTDAVVKEFVRRGRYRIVSDPSGADAVLEGTVTDFTVRNTDVDDQGRATRALVVITADLRFRNRLADEITWANESFTFTEEYDLAETSEEYVEQEVLAIDRLSVDFAGSVVSSILEGF